MFTGRPGQWPGHQMDNCMQEAEPISSEFQPTSIRELSCLGSLGAGNGSSVYRAVHVDTGHEVGAELALMRMAKNPSCSRGFCVKLELPSRWNIPTSCRSMIEESIRAGITSSSNSCQGVTCMISRNGRGPAQCVGGNQSDPAGGLRNGVVSASGLIHAISRHRRSFAQERRINMTDRGCPSRPNSDDERVTREGTTGRDG